MFRLVSRLPIITISLLVGYFAPSFAMHEIATIDQYHEQISQTRPSVILFYSPTCPICKNFKPIYTEAANNNSGKGNFFAVDATKPEFRDAIYELGIQEVPVVIYKEVGFQNKSKFGKTLDSFLGASKTAKAPTAKMVKPAKKIVIAKKASAKKTATPSKIAQTKGKPIQKLALKSNNKK